MKRRHTVLAFENRERFMQVVKIQGLDSRTDIMDISNINMPRLWPLTTDGRIFLFGACVSDHSGIVQMHSEGALASVHPQNFFNDPEYSNTKEPIEIAAVRLDSTRTCTCSRSNQDMHLLKIDTQGHELGVLRGARRLFEEGRVNMVALEFWPKGMAAGGGACDRGLEGRNP